MNVIAIPSDFGACGHYRVIWPGRAVAQMFPDDADVRVVNPRSFRFGQDRVTRRMAVDGLSLDGADVLVIQRVGSPLSVELIRWAQAQGVAVVVDFDDAMWCIDPANAAHREWNGGDRARELHWKWCDEAARQADLVTVTTQALARRYGKHGRVQVIPNYLPQAAMILWSDLDLRQERRAGDPVRIGWAGTLKSHPKDLQVMGDAVSWAVRELGAEFHVLGDGKGVADAVGLRPGEVTVHGYVPLTEYHAGLDVFDVGLVPLVDSPFNRAKSWLKAMEYAGRGIAVVASGTPANRELSGWLAAGGAMTTVDTVAGWKTALEELATDPQNLTDAQTGLRDGVRHLSIEGRAGQWLEAWDRAGVRRKLLLS